MAERPRTRFAVGRRRPTFVASRLFDAPPEVVFAAYTEPRHIAAWWGGGGGTTVPVCEVDLRPGGAWRFVTRLPDGEESTAFGEYLEVEAPRRLVFTLALRGRGWSRPAGTVTITFAPRRGRTALTLTTVFRSWSDRAAWSERGARRGSIRGMEALAKHLNETGRGTKERTVVYFEDRGGTFDAPLEVVWDYLLHDEKYHPRAHRGDLRGLRWKELNDITGIGSCEVVRGGRWIKMASRSTTVPPLARIHEELEGEYAGSAMVIVYRPLGRKTGVDLYVRMVHDSMSPSALERETRATLAKAYRADSKGVREFSKHRRRAGR